MVVVVSSDDFSRISSLIPNSSDLTQSLQLLQRSRWNRANVFWTLHSVAELDVQILCNYTERICWLFYGWNNGKVFFLQASVRNFKFMPNECRFRASATISGSGEIVDAGRKLEERDGGTSRARFRFFESR
jgi:hypothetical protein